MWGGDNVIIAFCPRSLDKWFDIHYHHCRYDGRGEPQDRALQTGTSEGRVPATGTSGQPGPLAVVQMRQTPLGGRADRTSPVQRLVRHQWCHHMTMGRRPHRSRPEWTPRLASYTGRVRAPWTDGDSVIMLKQHGRECGQPRPARTG